MYDELFRKMMVLMKATGDNGREYKTVTKRNVDRFISICLAHGINTWVIEQMIISHGKLSSGFVIDRLELFLDEAKVRTGPKVSRVERDGVTYDSVREMARELNIALSSAQYQIRKGIARLLDDEQ